MSEYCLDVKLPILQTFISLSSDDKKYVENI